MDKAMQRKADLRALSFLSDHWAERTDGRLTSEGLDKVDSMLRSLMHPNRTHDTLSEPQRRMVRMFCEWLDREFDPNDPGLPPAERNKDVPKGQEVATPLVLKALPLLPPHRRPREGEDAVKQVK